MTNSQTAKGFLDKHYASQAEVHCNTCNVASWVINREQNLYKTRNERGLFLKNFIKRICTTKPKDETCQVAVETATCKPETVCTDCKILIVSKGKTFSQDVMGYAVNLATKTRSSLVALNLDEKGLSFDSFRNESIDNVSSFSTMAAEAGLQFEHIVEKGTESAVVAKLYNSDEAFRYVLDDVDGSLSRNQIIPVYTRATMRAK